ncbi:MAG: hypothetical protein GY862_18695 [Gammaproteobacteria bacterium]|nr:hypothetical protein [Gammaproteobacteria bacterium]
MKNLILFCWRSALIVILLGVSACTDKVVVKPGIPPQASLAAKEKPLAIKAIAENGSFEVETVILPIENNRI